MSMNLVVSIDDGSAGEVHLFDRRRIRSSGRDGRAAVHFPAAWMSCPLQALRP
jgi:hypothetical protein